MSSDLDRFRARSAERLPLSVAALKLGVPEAHLSRYLTLGRYDFPPSALLSTELLEGPSVAVFSIYETHNLQNLPALAVRRRSERMSEMLSDIHEAYWEKTTRPMERMQQCVSSLNRLAAEYGVDAAFSSISDYERPSLPRVPELHGALDRLSESLTKRDSSGRILEIPRLTISHILNALTAAMTVRRGKGRKPLIDTARLSNELSADFQWLTGRPKKVHRNSAVLPLRDFKVACLRLFGIPASENLVRGREQRRSKRP